MHYIHHPMICAFNTEFIVFENPHTGLHQLSHGLRNVYYHAQKQCIGQHAKIIVRVLAADEDENEEGVVSEFDLEEEVGELESA